MKSTTRAIALAFGLALLSAGCTPEKTDVSAKPEQAENGAQAAKAADERAFMEQPNAFFEARLDEPPVTVDGQTLHPKLQYEFQERRKQRAKSGRDYNKWLFDKWVTTDGRAWLRSAAAENWVEMAYQVTEPVKTRDIAIPGPNGDIRARVYWPQADTQTPKPILMYFHGGGFIMASIEAIEPQAKILATKGDIIVVSVDYALAPEHPFPAAHLDAIAAYDWLSKHTAELGGDPERIGIGGDSAGGNLAIDVSDERARRGESVPKAQLLYYPFTDIHSTHYKSYEIFGDGYGLDKNFIKMATKEVFSDQKDRDHRWMTPLLSVDFAKQPKTIVATAGFDPIRDQGVLFADALREHGVEVVHKHYPSLNHGFLEDSGVIDDAQKASFETAELIGGMLRE